MKGFLAFFFFFSYVKLILYLFNSALQIDNNYIWYIVQMLLIIFTLSLGFVINISSPGISAISMLMMQAMFLSMFNFRILD